MPSVWVEKTHTSSGKTRWRVRYRLGGRGTRPLYAGQFKTKREAIERAGWVSGELAAMRVPSLKLLTVERPKSPTFAAAGERFRASRLDVAEGTKVQQRTSLNRAIGVLGARRVYELVPQDIADMVAQLYSEGLKPSYIRKIVQATAMVLDHASVKPNPARDKTIVKLPREEPEEVNPPTVDHVMTVFRLLPPKHRLALLWLDWSGARVSSVDLTLVGDYDERRRRVRLRAKTTKTRRALWVELPDVLADALEATLPPREDRDPHAPLFASSGADALRTSIAKACIAAGIPLFSPHDLRHRRISLLHLRGVPWARIGEMVGQRNLAVTANTYSHVMLDEAEVDYARLLRDRSLAR
jgi:integrase